MDTVEFLLADGNAPFRISGAIVALLALIEIGGMVIGMAPSGFFDSLLPDLHLDAPDADHDFAGTAFGWLNVGRVPVLVLLIGFLAAFTVTGFVVQSIAAPLGALLPAAIAAVPAVIVAVPATRLVSRVLGHLLPQDESYVIDSGAFIGRVGTVSLGPVTRETPGKIKIAGPHGDTHFLRVRTANGGDRFDMKDQVLVVAGAEGLYDVIAAPVHLRLAEE